MLWIDYMMSGKYKKKKKDLAQKCNEYFIKYNFYFRIQSVEIENRQILAECLVTLGEETVSENDEDQLEIMDYEEFESREDEYDDDDDNKQPSPVPINPLSLDNLLN